MGRKRKTVQQDEARERGKICPEDLYHHRRREGLLARRQNQGSGQQQDLVDDEGAEEAYGQAHPFGTQGAPDQDDRGTANMAARPIANPHAKLSQVVG